MINSDNLCMSCMKDIGTQKQCPHCGFAVDSPQTAPYLPIRTVIGNRYLVGRLLDYNGDGATYMGWDMARKTAVTVREFFPDAIAERMPGGCEVLPTAGSEAVFGDCCQSFLELWRKLVRFRGLSALICAVDIVEDFGTAYAVSEYVEGVTLREYLLGSKTGYINWERARQLFMPVLSTLGTLHSAGIVHRGLSPTTLIVGKDGKMRISGFSIWQARTARGELTAQLFPGYAAIEQYGFKGQQGPWTDIYAFAAVLYRALIGTDPIVATERVTNDRLMIPGKFAEQLPAFVINGLVNALQILPEDRTRSVEELRAELSASPSAIVASGDYGQEDDETSGAPERVSKRKKKPKRRGSTPLTMLVSFLIVLIIGLGAFFIILYMSGNISFGGMASAAREMTTEAVADKQGNVVVSDFRGHSYVTVTQNPVFGDRFVFIPKYEYDDTVGNGYIISQSIEPDTEVKKGTEIILTVSKGSETITLDNYVGMDFTAAKTAMTALGLECISTEKVNDGAHVGGTIASMSPTQGATVNKGSKVYVQVWKAIEPQQ